MDTNAQGEWINEVEPTGSDPLEMLPEEYREKVKSFVGSMNTFRCDVYKVEKGRNVHVDEVRDHVPSEKEIGSEYGGGEYKIRITGWHKKAKKHSSITLEYVLSNRYDAVKSRAALSGDSPAPAALNPMEQMQQVMGLMQAMMATFVTPLIESMGKRGPSEEKLLATLFEKADVLFEKNLNAQEEVLAMHRELNGGTGKVLAAPEPDMKREIIQIAIDFIAKKGQEFLSASGPKRAAQKMLLTSHPYFGQLRDDPDAVQKITEAVGQSLGSDKAAELLREFGFQA